MNLCIFFTDKFKKNHNVKLFFTIVDSNLTIDSEGQKTDFNLNQISNVRIIKKRNLTPNFLILIGVFISYFSFLSSQNIDDRLKNFTLMLIVLGVLVSFLFKHYSYKLLINKKNYCFNEFKISKQNLNIAQSFVSMFKNNNTTLYVNSKKESSSYLSECLA
jgi:hypothetical protein